MEKKSKLAIFDLDGTLFDTKNVNFEAYSQALKNCGFEQSIDYQYYCEFCNGNSYKIFLPVIIDNITSEEMSKIHEEKKKCYKACLQYAIKNEQLFSIISLIRNSYCVALVTTASRENVLDILSYFGVQDEFDYIITQEDVEKTKPSPEGFVKAIELAEVEIKDTIIFEDSDVGIKAAEQSGAKYVKVYGYN